MIRIKISKPDRLPREGVTDIDLHTWKNELINYLSQDDNFDVFEEDGQYPSWEAAESNKHRILTAVEPDTQLDLIKRRKQLSNFITIIAGCCHKDHYMTIIEQSTSLDWIWNELKGIYQIVHVGKDFLNIVDIKFDPTTMSATTVYNAYRSKIMENLKPSGTTIKWKNNKTLTSAESLTPTFEDHILLSVLQLIDNRLPLKVREVYGPRMDNTKFLMDFKQDILTNVSKMIEDLESVDTQLNWMKMGKSNEKPQRQRNNGFGNKKPNQKQSRQNLGKFCRLCHLARKPRNEVTSHEIGDSQCPSLSTRDRDALQQKFGRLGPVVPQEEDDLDSLAQLHGYEPEDANNHETQGNIISDSQLSFISPVPSQILTLYQNDKIVHIDLDSGCWVSCVKADFAREMGWKILPNSQLAKLADDKTILKSIGEINETFKRNNWQVNFRALVLTQLHTNVIGGNNFLKDNNVEQSIINKNITVHGKYVVPETNRSVKLPTQMDTILISTVTPKVLLQNQAIAVKVPLEDGKKVIAESRLENKVKHWPQSQLCEVRNGKISVENSTKKPIHFSNKDHHIQLVQTTDLPTNAKHNPNYSRPAMDSTTTQFSVNDLSINFKILNNDQKNKLISTLEINKAVFNKDLTQGYNQASGKHHCKLNWASDERPIARKVACANYNTGLNHLLQDVCDQLTNNGVLGIPQEDNIIIQHVSPCFLRKNRKPKTSHLVN